MKDKVESLIALSLAMEPIKAQLHAQVKRVAVEFATAEAMRYENCSDQPYKPEDVFDWNIEGETISANWSTHWNYGGHAEGCLSFPAKYLYDTELFDSYKAECQQMKTKWEEEKKQASTREKQAQLKRLKSELNIK